MFMKTFDLIRNRTWNKKWAYAEILTGFLEYQLEHDHFNTFQVLRQLSYQSKCSFNRLISVLTALVKRLTGCIKPSLNALFLARWNSHKWGDKRLFRRPQSAAVKWQISKLNLSYSVGCSRYRGPPCGLYLVPWKANMPSHNKKIKE